MKSKANILWAFYFYSLLNCWCFSANVDENYPADNCADSRQLKLTLVKLLMQKGENIVKNKVPNLQNLKGLYQLALKSHVSYCQSIAYKKFSYHQKIQFELHHLLQLAKVEQSKDFKWSRSLTKLLPNYDRLTNETKSYTCNIESCELNLADAKDISPQLVCNYFNLGAVVEQKNKDFPYIRCKI